MNLIGLTSSRSDERTNAYTERILSDEGKVFSSWVRSLNLTRIVVCLHLSSIQQQDKGQKLTLGHLSLFAFSTACLVARNCKGALTNARVRAVSVACAALRSAVVGVKYDSGSSLT